MPPEMIAGRYRVEREVGRGGMGTVWLCRDESLGRLVALKQMTQLADEPAPARERALREARAAASLSHRNVVSVFDVVDEESPWLVMEYVPSRTLAQVLAEEGPLPPRRAAWLGAQVADGLAAAHARGIIHRDVKPGNVLVTDDDVAKVSDFGIARRVTDETLTSTGFVRGSPPYFSPELARGGVPSPAADVWALGVTLSLLVEGEHPYPPQGNPLALLQRIVSEAPPRPEHAGPLTEPISRMMDPDPASRWSMDDAAHALRRVAGPGGARGWKDDETPTVPVAAVPPPAGEPAAGQPATGEPATAEPATAEPAADEPAAAGAPPTDEPVPASGPRRGPGPLAALVTALVLLVVAGTGYALLTSGGSSPEAGPAGTASTATTARPSPTGSSPSRSGSGPGSGAGPGQTEPTAQQTEQTPQKTEPTPTATGRPAPAADTGEMVGFVESYYDQTMPGDLDTGWTMLSGRFRSEVGRDSYESFWDDVEEVEASGTTPAGSSSVLTTLTYHFDDGRVVRERQRIDLVREGGGYRIDNDTPLSSHTVRG
ncbi:MAG TPA: serine/threonine-protein kinase [Nocardioidaceae bacterium]